MKTRSISMKNIFSSTKRVYSLMVLMLVASLMFTMVGCSSESDDVVLPIDKYSTIPEEELMTFESHIEINDWMGDAATDKDGDVILFASSFNSIVYLPSDHPDYYEYYDMLNTGGTYNPLRYTIRKSIDRPGRFALITLEKLSPEQEKEMREEVHESTGENTLIPFGNRVSSTVSQSNKEYGYRLSNAISYSQAKDFFDDMKNMDCDQVQMCPCIAFQYAAAGCEARAHWMRKSFKEEFGFDCQKVFAFSVGGPFRVQTQVGCVAEWGTHIAPVVNVNGRGQYVIDPSIFTKPVKLSTWLEKLGDGVYGIESGRVYIMYRNEEKKYDDNYEKTADLTNELMFKTGCDGLKKNELI